MNKPPSSLLSRRDVCRQLLGLAGTAPLAMSWLSASPKAIADEIHGHIMRVEEDWYIKIGTPDPDSDSPQITTVMSPAWSTPGGGYGVFDLNCATQPNFSSGGVQIQYWSNNAIVQSQSNACWDSLRFTDEEITYTSVMRVEDNELVFEVINGTSSTWGSFGMGELIVRYPSWRNHLNHYDPDCSAYNSRIGWSSYEVRSFVLQRARCYSNSGLESTDNTPRVLHQYDPSAG